MAAEQVRAGVRVESATPTARWLGTLGMIGAPALLIEGIYRDLVHMTREQDDKVIALLSLVYITGWVASAVGMRRLRVTGKGWSGALVFVLQLLGLCLAGFWAVALLIGLDAGQGSLIFAVTDPFWPLSHLFMLVVGLFVWKAGVWRGWRLLAPFLCGLALLLFFVAKPLGSESVYPFLIMTAVGFTLLGLSVRSDIRARR